MKILILGDIVGRPGRNAVANQLSHLREEYKPDLVIVNGENASAGRGLTEKNAKELFELDIDVITTGNHVWDKKEILTYIESYPQLIRPANYPDPCPGKGYTIIHKGETTIGVINLSGVVYLSNLTNPFHTIDKILHEISKQCNIIILDFHAEATSEKLAMGYYCDGRISLVYGTHTHVQTADKRILNGGTGYITDIGMTGPLDGILGVDKDIIIQQMQNNRPARYDLAQGPVQINGIITEINEETGKCQSLDNFIRIIEE
ncbi:hypothetical protein DES36_11723 [Alkalibaculum bacchi]|uniref:TIGR00282 family metallophosphoesterase n=1 Tax=Alkalibaculum bacchi TaxID=645887 RepID=A0A366I1R8_9FIRM|nr:TIGR00282 family metallophosphoesterase [Alkalibaculum bacchi]RBP59928.1 hypothetical protein DES36_11723 [Alkalibaculum bacchi]